MFVTGRSDNFSTMPLNYASPAGPLVSGLPTRLCCNQAAGALVVGELCWSNALCAADVTGDRGSATIVVVGYSSPTYFTQGY